MRRRTRISMLAVFLAVLGTAACKPKSEGGSTDATSPPSGNLLSKLRVERTSSKTLAVIRGAPKGQNRVALVGRDYSVVVNPLFFVRMPEGKVSGEMGVARIKVGPNDTGQVSIGVFEQFAGGAGNTWRSAVFMASFISSLTLSKLMTDFQFSVHCGGSIDGPSAGGLMAAGMLAAMTGSPLRKDATMTGIINPDGTIGPVGGIPQKFTAAMNKGKKRLGYPVGQRISVDLATKKPVDLRELARRRGVEAIEIKDIYDAFKLLTGKTIPRPTPLDPAKMVLDARTQRQVEAFTKGWLAHCEKALAGYRVGGGENPVVRYLATKAEVLVRSSRALLAQRYVSAAYRRSLEAAVYATIAAYGASFFRNLAQQNWKGIGGELGKLMASTKVMDQLSKQLKALTPHTVNEFMGLIFAHSYVIQAIATSHYGRHKYSEAMKLLKRKFNTANGPPQDEQMKAVQSLLLPTMLLSTCFIMASAGTQIVAMSQFGIGRPIVVDKGKLTKLADMFSSAAITNLKYFESIELEPIAKRFNRSMDAVRSVLMDAKADYMLAHVGLQIGRVTHRKWGDSAASHMVLLAASLMSYLETSMLVSKAYSLRVKEDSTGEPIGVKATRAFDYMLKAAELRARENASAAVSAVGHVPIGALLSYRTAMVYRKGSVADQLQALSMFWTSSVISQVAVMLVRPH